MGKPEKGTDTTSLGVSVDSGETDYLSAAKYLPTSLVSPDEAVEAKSSDEFGDIQKADTMTSDLTIDSAFAPNTPRGIPPPEPKSVVNLTVNSNSHEGADSRSRSIGGSIFGILTSKPALSFFGLYAIFATGAFAYLLNRTLRIPGLDNQIDKLKKEVDTLTAQVGRFEEQNAILEESVDRFEEENAILEKNVDRFEEENAILEKNVDRFEEENAILEKNVMDLNNTVTDYKEQNNYLNISVGNLTKEVSNLENVVETQKEQNQNLMNQTKKLNNTVDELKKVNQNLTNQVLNVTTQNQKLNLALANLTESNQEFSKSVDALTIQVQNLTIGNEGLKKVNDDLIIIISYLNDINKTFANTTVLLDEIADQIDIERNITLKKLKFQYDTLSSNFECNYDSRFSNSPFIQDKNLSLGEENYNDVFDWVNNTFISDLCVNDTDFEKALRKNKEYEINVTFPLASINSNQLVVAQLVYSEALNKYYFPSAGEPGLTVNDWVDAEYNCTLLPNDKRFVYTFKETNSKTKQMMNVFEN